MSQTPLYQTHLDMGAKMVDFAGWQMPIQYPQGLVAEHLEVRSGAGMFDVSHMCTVDLHGDKCKAMLEKLVANDVNKLKERGKALYTCMLNSAGGVIDDLIIYYLEDNHYRLVVNAGTTEKDVAWLIKNAADFGVEVKKRTDLAMVAVQGPKAIERAPKALPAGAAEFINNLKRFEAGFLGDFFIARTGYTGEDGIEVSMPAELVVQFWKDLHANGVSPIGLGARDTLRLEAGMNLYGSDMDESTTPLVSGLAWTVVLGDERDFIGKQALLDQKAAGVPQKLVGIVLEGRGVMRAHQEITANGQKVGELTSGSFSPTLQQSIGFARVNADTQEPIAVRIRDKDVAAKIVRYPFVRDGKSCL